MFTVRGINNLPASSSQVLQSLILLIVAVIVHGLVLRFVFPGYYDPLWPIHSDFYLPVEIANAPAAIFSYITWPRPTGTVFFALIGKLGIHGSIAAIIFLGMLNAVLTALLVKKFLAINFNLKFLATFIVYVFLICSHPYFYSFYVHDAFSQLSYFLLLIGLLSYCELLKKSILAAAFLLFVSSVLAFLAKETFGGAALAVSAVWFLHERKKSLTRAVIPFAALSIALIVTFTFNFVIKSSFVTNSNAAYKVDLNPASVLTEWLHYVKLGYNVGSVLLLILIGFLVFSRKPIKDSKSIFVFIGCVLAFCAALLPNSLLPDHKHNGYSWTGAYIFFSIIFFLALPNIFSQCRRYMIATFFSFLAIALTFSQVVNYKKYNNSVNQWFIFQEKTQRNLLTSLKKLMEELVCTQKQKILISGISFPYSPFQNPRSLTPYLPCDEVSFDVVSYVPNTSALIRSEKVKDIPLDNVVFLDYSSVWMFGNDGRLVNSLSSDELGYSFELLASLKDFILFPEVASTLGVQFKPHPNLTKSNDGYKLLQSGNSYLSYQQPQLALEYFQESAKNIPDNPYPWYLAGIELEKFGRLGEAKQHFQKAVDLDPKNQNPAFVTALMRVKASLQND